MPEQKKDRGALIRAFLPGEIVKINDLEITIIDDVKIRIGEIELLFMEKIGRRNKFRIEAPRNFIFQFLTSDGIPIKKNEG